MSVTSTNTNQTNAQFEANQAEQIRQILTESQKVRAENQTKPSVNPSAAVQEVLNQIHQAQAQAQTTLVMNNDLETAFASLEQSLKAITDNDVQSVAMAGQRSDSGNPLKGIADSWISDLLFPSMMNPFAMMTGGGIANAFHMSQMSIGEGDARMKPAVEADNKVKEAAAARLADANFFNLVTGPQAGQLQVSSRMDAALAKGLQELLAKLNGRTEDLRKLISGSDDNLKSQLIETAIASSFAADPATKARYEAVHAYSEANRSYAATTKGTEGAVAGILEKMFSEIFPKVMKHEATKDAAIEQLSQNLDSAAMPEILESIAKLLIEAAGKLRTEQTQNTTQAA